MIRFPKYRILRSWSFAVLALVTACSTERPQPRSFTDGCTIDHTAEVQCDDCLRLEHEARLGSVDAPGFLEPRGGIEAVVRDLAGNYWVGQGEQINVYAPTGDFMTSVGREGEGPLEFRYARPLYASADGRVHLFDISNMRISVVDEGMALVAEQQLPAAINSIAALDDGERYVIQAWIQAPARSGFPVHIVEGGEIVQSFGSIDRTNHPEVASRASARRHLATSTDSDVFIAHEIEYVIEAWRPDGPRVGRIEGQPPLNEWREVPSAEVTADNPPVNSLADIQVDREGRLWVIAQIRRPDWLENSMEFTYPDGEVAMAPADMMPTSWFRTRIDVIDPQSCATVTSAWRDEFFVGFAADGYLVAGVMSEVGVPHVDVYRAELLESGY